ncbi:hypothetical protein EDB87DRAFT_1830498 [Lactarius vividus]|nr:hypothetical protein EDB87DRAFT_1830498 [Lactarius vividus]
MSTMFTRSAAIALRVTIGNGKLPEEVLLEIFDAYRQLHEHQPDYEKVWNSRDGWFKLAHVCINWRHIVLLSSSRLRVHLLFTPRRSPTNPVLRRLPPLPILVDYRTGLWTAKEERLALAAIRHRSRKVSKCPPHSRVSEPILRTTFLSGSAPSLRRLTLRGVGPEYLSPLLSSATGLVELALTPGVMYGALPEASLIANLQRILHKIPNPPPPACARALSKLTDLILVGHGPYLQVLMGSLAVPSLQHLDVEILAPHTSFVPHLCKFICDAECQFIAVRLDFSIDFSGWKLGFFAETCPKSGHPRPFRIIFPEPVLLEEIGFMLAGPLSTVEELVVEWDTSLTTQQGDRIQWRMFFNHIRRVKMVQVPSPVALSVAHSIQLGGQEPALDFLPALEHVKVPLTYLSPIVSKDSILDAFEPLISARKQVGRPIRLSFPRGDKR